ncbi:MAG TPA: DUF2905 domain-containing protein [Candidatus Dormibacteraeota bacterium]|nr:DUF2905 domain-containing protein [Candidatus Dormibacteraeota bacterium]
MSGFEPVGRALLVLGVVLVSVGLVLVLAPKVPFLGRLPGDIRIERDGLTIYIPIATMVLVSVLLSVVVSILGRR